MKKIHTVFRAIRLFLILLTVLTFLSCASRTIEQEPGTDDFYDQTRLIMTKNEIKIYKHLADQAAKDAFIADFWKIRDPSPETVENEYKEEFERRVDYANRWFRDNTGSRKGWDSDRGKVYIILGEPDERVTTRKQLVDRFGELRNADVEIWVYDLYRLSLIFTQEDGLGRFTLDHWPVELLSAFERAKIDIRQNKDDNKQFLSFKAKYIENNLLIEIPSDKINFKPDKNDPNSRVTASFQVKIIVYSGHKKIEEKEIIREIADRKEVFLEQKNVRLTIPYTLPSGDSFYFDIVVKDIESGSSWRGILRKKN